MLGLGFGFGGSPKDTDGDGVVDRKDKCPNTPRGAIVDATGCPLDADGDGVYDGIDKCPDTPKGVKVDASGCPLDSDGDGVADYLDKCPSTPRNVKVDKDGCPVDGDGDGVPDYLDKCPGTPKGVRVDRDGCPPDSDGDGVSDYLDKCPDTPRGVKVDSSGCPLAPPPPAHTTEPIFKAGKKSLVLEGVNFEYDKAKLTAESEVVLDRVAASLVDWSDVNVEIAGHTDSRGADAYNMKLSQARADAVRDYLASKGVAASRMTTKGYGETTPIADNKTDAGRAKNRRVELAADQLVLAPIAKGRAPGRDPGALCYSGVVSPRGREAATEVRHGRKPRARERQPSPSASCFRRSRRRVARSARPRSRPIPWPTRRPAHGSA